MNTTKVAPVTLPISGEIVEQIEVFDPRVLPSRPDATPPFAGSVSCLVRLYDRIGNQVGQPIRSDKTSLTPTQYAGWTDAVTDDAAYFTDCIIANLGLTKA